MKEMLAAIVDDDASAVKRLLRADAGLAVQLVNASQAKNLPGRPKTDKLDAMWLAG